jgi:hypothetical protein
MIEAKWMDNYNRVHEKCCDGVMPRMLWSCTKRL